MKHKRRALLLFVAVPLLCLLAGCATIANPVAPVQLSPAPPTYTPLAPGQLLLPDASAPGDVSQPGDVVTTATLLPIEPLPSAPVGTPDPATGTYFYFYGATDKAISQELDIVANGISAAQRPGSAQDSVFGALDHMRRNCTDVLATPVPAYYKELGTFWQRGCQSLTRAASRIKAGLQNGDAEQLSSGRRDMTDAVSDFSIARDILKVVGRPK